MIKKAFVLECDVVDCHNDLVIDQKEATDFLPLGWVPVAVPFDAARPYKEHRRLCICPNHITLKKVEVPF